MGSADMSEILDAIFGSTDFWDRGREILGNIVFLNIVGVILGIIVLIAYYLITSYKWMFMGRKAGLNRDWMPFFPFARTVYRLSIVGEEWWKMFFLSGSFFYGSLLFIILAELTKRQQQTFVVIIVTAYLLACLAYKTYWRYKFYLAHNIRPHLSLGVLIPAMAPVLFAWDYLIAFSRNYPFTGEGTSRAMMDVVNVPRARDTDGNVVSLTKAVTPADRGAPWQEAQANSAAKSSGRPAGAKTRASMTGLSGMYTGQTIQLVPGDEIIVGRDNALCNLIVDENAEKISRKHCSIMFHDASGTYMVVDYSTNGTFVDGANRLASNMRTSLKRGTVIALGNRENRFRLN